jgi:hypothetical protein
LGRQIGDRGSLTGALLFKAIPVVQTHTYHAKVQLNTLPDKPKRFLVSTHLIKMLQFTGYGYVMSPGGQSHSITKQITGLLPKVQVKPGFKQL